MTEFTDEQIAQVEAAGRAIVKRTGNHNYTVLDLIAELQPKPKVTEEHAKMTEFTDEQLREIEHRMREHISTSNDNISRVMQSLKPGPKFTEGQVGAYIELENDFPNQEWTDCGNLPPIGLESARPLNQTEVGPNWMRREVYEKLTLDHSELWAEFEKLRDAAKILCAAVGKETICYDEWSTLDKALDSLPDHLKGGE